MGMDSSSLSSSSSLLELEAVRRNNLVCEKKIENSYSRKKNRLVTL
jgi:hypothetical protein